MRTRIGRLAAGICVALMSVFAGLVLLPSTASANPVHDHPHHHHHHCAIDLLGLVCIGGHHHHHSSIDVGLSTAVDVDL